LAYPTPAEPDQLEPVGVCVKKLSMLVRPAIISTSVDPEIQIEPTFISIIPLSPYDGFPADPEPDPDTTVK